jgi:hypothetical protein
LEIAIIDGEHNFSEIDHLSVIDNNNDYLE